MASYTLYPPIIDSSAPAFAGDTCTLTFQLSKYSTEEKPIVQTQVAILKKNTGLSVVNKDENEDGRFGSSGILIINAAPYQDSEDENLWHIDIKNNDIRGGWEIGSLYKIQLRLSTVQYTDTSIGQTQWLVLNANNFSEWSTFCVVKVTDTPHIEVGISDIVKDSTLDLYASYNNNDITELLYSYQIILLKDNEIYEQSDYLYSNTYFSNSLMHYLFKKQLINGNYKLKIAFTTINFYSDIYEKNFTVEVDEEKKLDIVAITNEDMKPLEEDDGRIKLKLYSESDLELSGVVLCLCRTDASSDFQVWTDIKEVVCNGKVNDLSPIYDNTIESGVWYRYGVQAIYGRKRSVMNYLPTETIRDFEYSFLIGKGGRQLRLPYNISISDYSYNIVETKVDTIGSKYPIIIRNGNTKYRTFPLAGVITFNMDENKLFISDKELYGVSDDIVNKYNSRLLGMNDQKREHNFREAVIDFLQDGKPKLFKSASEGNIIIRLMNVKVQPQQNLNRLICNFSATAYEIADCNMDNYLKYGFYSSEASL